MANKRSPTAPVTHASGRVIAAFRNGVYLIETRRTPRRATPPSETAAALAKKLGRALSKPGLSKDAVFGKGKRKRAVYAYCGHPEEPTNLLVRESADGKRTIGRIIDGRFCAVRKADRGRLRGKKMAR